MYISCGGDVTSINTTTMKTEILSKSPKQKMQIEWLLKQDSAEYKSYLDGEVQVVTYSPRGAYPVAAIFGGKRAQPDSLYRYASEQRRLEAILEAVESAKRRMKYKEERKAVTSVPKQYEVGDIVYTSWGYEQTNLDFYQVVEVSGKATVYVRPISSKTVRTTSWCSEDRSPVKDAFIGEKVIKCRSTYYGIKIGSEHASKASTEGSYYCSWGY